MVVCLSDKRFVFLIIWILFFLIFFKYLQSDVDVDGDYVHLEPIDIITKDVHSLKQIVNDKKEKAKELGKHFGKDTEHVQVDRQGNEGRTRLYSSS